MKNPTSDASCLTLKSASNTGNRGNWSDGPTREPHSHKAPLRGQVSWVGIHLPCVLQLHAAERFGLRQSPDTIERYIDLLGRTELQGLCSRGFGHIEVIPNLLAALDDDESPQVVNNVAWSLRQLDDTLPDKMTAWHRRTAPALKTIMEALDDPDLSVHEHAGRALRQMEYAEEL